MEITVDDAVMEFIVAEGIDYRLCTTCSGPALVPTLIKPPKGSDIKIPVNELLTLYISRVQLGYVSHITMDMVYDPEKIFSCQALSGIRNMIE
ncbi:MAG: hypothetical protein FWD37_00770 [Methanomassiliicoccaceae archaeon]|nr:hypothetical protein [Methanomassiliicoccaceae archaeon]